MNRATQNWALAYLALMLLLTVVGATNQGLYTTQTALIEEKEALQLEVSDLRATASYVSGTLAVRQWAYARGMVPATLAPSTHPVPASPAPDFSTAPDQLEIRTLWR